MTDKLKRLDENESDHNAIAGQKQTRTRVSPVLWAIAFTAAIAAWMLSGKFVIGGRSSGEGVSIADVADNETDQGRLFKVRVQRIVLEQRNATLILRGQTESDARVQVRAETAGRVVRIAPSKGALVKKGELLCGLEPGARLANVDQTRARLVQAEAAYAASKKLVARGHTGELKMKSDSAALTAAQAALARAELDLKYTSIEAPFEGVIEAQPAKVGDFLAVGGACARLVKLDPLVVAGAVSERDVSVLKVGMTGTAKLATGETVNGRIRFVSPSSDVATKTFRIELEVSNPDRSLRDGVTADIIIPLVTEPAYRISRSIVALRDDGTIGVRIVTDGGIVKFVPIKIVADGTSGFWAAGLPDNARIITVGQEYVVDGQKVAASTSESAMAAQPNSAKTN